MWFRRRSDRAYDAARERVATVNADLQEGLSGVREAQAFGRVGRNVARFRELDDDYRRARLPGGYWHPVAERGKSLSAGQRQLVALARARLVDPVVLLLDEATANLDLATEARVARAMGLVSRGRTTLVIAHRLPTARAADRVVVIDAGRVVESGTHAELLARDGAYAAMWAAFGADAQPAAGAAPTAAAV